MRTFFILIFFLNCNLKPSYNTLISNREQALKQFAETSFIVRNETIVFSTYQNALTNIYFLTKEGGKYSIINDSLQYSNFIDTQIIIKQVQSLEVLISKFGLLGYTFEFSQFGIDYVFYLENGSVVLYVPNISKLNGEYLKQVSSSKKILNMWYYSETW